MKPYKKILILLISITVSVVNPYHIIFAYNDFYSSNNILFYNGSDDVCINMSYGTPPTTADLSSFVDMYGQSAYDIGNKYGIPYEAMLAQAMLESGYGKSELAYKYYNFFGMKAGDSWTGGTIELPTKEQDSNGIETTIMAKFRTYPDANSGWEGYALFITNNGNPGIYKDALNYYNNYTLYIQAIKDAGYATDINYVKKVVEIANSVANYIAINSKWAPSSESQKPAELVVNISKNFGTFSNCASATADASWPENVVAKGSLGGWTLKDNVDYSSIACAPGTTDNGIYTHPEKGFIIRKCKTSSLGDVSSLVSNKVYAMINAAAQDGIELTGWSFRTYEEQAQLRLDNNCEDQYEASANTCDPPTARPGESMHERGLAIDISGIDKIGGTNEKYLWLVENAKYFGFINLSTEGWHWSVSGS